MDRYWNSSPAMADLLCDLLAGVSVEQLRPRAASIMRQIERYRVREPGEDDRSARDTTSEGERIESLACAALVA
jgi:hypothetical protein